MSKKWYSDGRIQTCISISSFTEIWTLKLQNMCVILEHKNAEHTCMLGYIAINLSFTTATFIYKNDKLKTRFKRFSSLILSRKIT